MDTPPVLRKSRRPRLGVLGLPGAFIRV
jgi:hypothetical protein